jgi:hypothetical protein
MFITGSHSGCLRFWRYSSSGNVLILPHPIPVYSYSHTSLTPFSSPSSHPPMLPRSTTVVDNMVPMGGIRRSTPRTLKTVFQMTLSAHAQGNAPHCVSQ